MRNFIMTLAFLLISFPALAAETIIVHVNGMVCDFCAQAIEKVMVKEPGISSVQIDLDSSTVSFTPDEGATVTDEFIKDLMVDSGYDVDKIERK